MKNVVAAVVTAMALVVTLALAGCVTDPNAHLTASAQQTLAALDGLSGEERVAAVMAYAATQEAEVRRASGVDDALGGTEQATEAFAALRAPLNDLVDARASAITFTPASLQDAPSGFDTFVGLGFVMIGWMGENAMDLADRGELGSQQADTPGGTAEITIAPDGSVGSTFSTQATQGEMSAALKAETQLQACPDPEGNIELTGTSQVRVSAKNASFLVSLDIVATGRLDDTATLVASDYTYRSEIASSSGGTGEYFDHSAGARAGVTVNRTSSNATLAFQQSAVDSAAALANMVANDMMDAAKRGWESGRCVDLTVTPSEDPGSLEPEAHITIEAAPHSTLDGQPTGGTVVATLSGGGDLAQGGSPVAAAATYDYTAADEKNVSGTISFESRSNRGVGKATLAVETGGQAYSATGTQGEFTASGTICSLTSQFVLTGAGLTLTFTPAGESDGTFRLTGVEDGVSFIGDGTYSVIRNSDYLATNLAVEGELTLTTPEGVAAPSLVDLDVALTPIEPCE